MLSLSRFIGSRCSPAGAGRRRTWSAEDKARIVRRLWQAAFCLWHGPTARAFAAAVIWLAPGLQGSQTALSHAEELQFAPAVVTPSSPSVRRQSKMRLRQIEPDAGMIEVEIEGVAVRVSRGADAKTVTAVLRALKAGT
jgi:transposase